MSEVVGICGGSASGKTTLAHKLCNRIGEEYCSIISMDNYYIDFPASGINPADVNYDQPESIDTELFISDITDLKNGNTIHAPAYNFTTHRREIYKSVIIPGKIIIVEGLFLYNSNRLAEIFDLKVFIDTPSDICLCRRIIRDIESRDRSFKSVLNQYISQVRPMYNKYVIPNRDMSDLIVNGECITDKDLDEIVMRMELIQ
ncbi:MAG: uridine kinase [Bacteroidales bacterium]|nr:uridine kinase [Bacteroidales bacterium]